MLLLQYRVVLLISDGAFHLLILLHQSTIAVFGNSISILIVSTGWIKDLLLKLNEKGVISRIIANPKTIDIYQDGVCALKYGFFAKGSIQYITTII